MTSDVIDTAQPPPQDGDVTNIGQVVQVVQVEPLEASLGDRARSEATDRSLRSLLDHRLVESAT